MKKTILLLVILSIVLSGCVVVMIDRMSMNDETIITTDEKAKVYAYAGLVEEDEEDENDNKIILDYEDLEISHDYPQIRIEADSCKTIYTVIDRVETDSVHYELQKFTYWSETLKRLYLSDLSFNLEGEENFSTKYDNILDCVNENHPLAKTELKYKDYNKDEFIIVGEMKNDLRNLLKKLKYYDSSSVALVSNQNSLYLGCEITKYNQDYFFYTRKSIKGPLAVKRYTKWIENNKLEVRWILKDIYGDTLMTTTIKTKSGFFSRFFYKSDILSAMARKDAIELSFMEFLKNPEVSKLMQLGSDTIQALEPIAIQVPVNSPSDADQAMKASVTIKIDDRGFGSGFAVSHNGYIITNYNVVNGDHVFKAILSDGNEYEVEVIRSDKILDLALLKIDHVFEYAFFMPDAKNYKVGKKILALGTPESIELGQSFSAGIISGVRKKNNRTYIQMNAKINRGNRGGAVILRTGELVGVVDYKLSGVGTEGLSFAIPACEIKDALKIINK